MVSILMDKPFCKNRKNKIKQKQRLVKHLNSEVETETGRTFAMLQQKRYGYEVIWTPLHKQDFFHHLELWKKNSFFSSSLYSEVKDC